MQGYNFSSAVLERPLNSHDFNIVLLKIVFLWLLTDMVSVIFFFFL